MKYHTLREFISSDRETEKILIVRDRHWATDELDLCALDGTPSVGVHIMTFEEVLTEYVAPEQGLLTESESLVILERVLRRLQKDGELNYYSENLNSPTLTGELRKVLTEIRMSDFDRKEKTGFHLRIEELLKLSDAYEEELRKLGSTDLADCWRSARGEEMNPNFQYAVYADTPVSDRERRFLNGLPNLTVLKVPRVSSPIPTSFYDERGIDDSIKYYFEKDDILSKSHTLKFERHYLASQEVRSVFEDIQRRKLSPAEVEIVYADPSYARLLMENAKTFSLSVEMGDGTDVSAPILSDWLSALESFCRSKCGFKEFERLMSRHLFRFRKSTWEKLMKVFRKRNFRAGQGNYSLPEDFQVESPEKLTEIREFLKDLLELVPNSMFETVSLKEYGDRVRVFLSRYVRTSEEGVSSFGEEPFSYEMELLQQLNMWEEHWKTVSEEEMNYDRTFRRLSQMCSAFPPKKPNFSFPSVLIRGLIPRRPWKRKHCYLCGLTANVFPKVVEESSVLNDEERAQLTDTLFTSETRNDEEKYEIKKLMASFSNSLYTDRGRSLYFSCPVFDLSTNTEIVPSILPEQWARAYGEKGWKDFGFYSEGEEAEKVFDNFTWEKISGEERKTIEQFFREFVFSSSSIEQLMKCPQCFYYKYVMRLPEVSEEKSDEWEWMDSKGKGNLCHEILNRFFIRRERKNNLSCEEARSLFLEIMDEEVDKAREKNPPVRRRVFEDAVFELKDAMSSYFDQVLRFEWSEPTTFYSEKNFTEQIRIGKYSIRLNGRIDLMCLRDSELLIVDFKTGKRKRIEEKSRSDELIQDMLYTEAMKVRFGGEKPIRTEYHFPFLKEKDMRFSELNAGERFQRRKEKIEKMMDLILDYGFVSAKQFTELPAGYEVLRKNSKEAERAHLYGDFKDLCR